LLAGKFLERFKQQPESSLTSFLYPLASPNYAITLTENQRSELVISVRPQLFSDTGAAGLYYVAQTAVKLIRGSDSYTPEEMEAKTRFEAEFSNVVE
jgi:hypothetical protein